MSAGTGQTGTIAAIEWPTLGLAAVIYGGWLMLIAFHAHVPLLLACAIGAWLIAWHGSLQHETIHGHPTRNAAINDAIGYPPLALWLPYWLYAREHAAHHATPHLSDPYDDTESNYLARPGGLAHALALLEATLVGRVVFGPPIRVGRLLIAEVQRARRDPAGVARDWVPHALAAAAVLAWVSHCGLPIVVYICGMVWPGLGLTLIRAYAEHRADADPAARTAIIADRGPLALLFLNNNLHSWHHANPAAPWYALPAMYRANPAAFPKAPRYRHYGEVIARFAFAPHDRLVHPAPIAPEAARHR